MPSPPPSTVVCPKPGCGATIAIPQSALVRFAECPKCHAAYDKAKLMTLVPSALPAVVEPSVQLADPRAKALRQRTCSDPECGTCTDKSTCPKCGSPTLIDAAFIDDPLIGRVLNESFEVVERLGGGGFGTVYRARQLRMKRDVALKVVRAEWRGDLEMARRFVREAQLVSRLEHPSTIRVYEFGQTDDGVLFLAMELLRGETLTARLARVKRFPPAEAVHIMACVARSLDEAHAHGIVHRDLKPDNVVLHQPVRGEEVVKVLDFGIAKMTQERTSLFQTGSLRTLGTPLYMAPEQIRSEAVDGRTDLYALGVMLHELLSGRPPFDAASAAQVMHLHETAEPPELPADVPPGLRVLCKRLLQKRREDRPESAEAVVRWLDAALVAPAGFVLIQPGTFIMGSPESEADRSIDEVQHTVRITRPFWLGVHPVTQAEWRRVMGTSPSAHKDCPECPVENVSWYEAIEYCNKRSAEEGLEPCYSGRTFKGLSCTGYRLPTEAEWEYAARAGTTGARYGEPDAVAWYDENSGGQSHPVGQKQANAWGLYDMLGNVWEWCGDGYDPYPTGSAIDPLGSGDAPYRVFRGSSWDETCWWARAASRDGAGSSYRHYSLGFRVARSGP